MAEILTTVGKIAGIGGLSLGVFLLLFKRIHLPRGTRNHLTLYMWLVWSICIIGLVAYFAGQFISQKAPQDIQNNVMLKYEKTIYLTDPDENDFASFLNDNIGQTIQVSTFLDFSPLDIGDPVGFENADFLADQSSTIFLGQNAFLKLNLLNGRELPFSSGGTGVLQLPLDGFFTVSVTYHGTSNMYHLTEIPLTITAPLGK